MAFILTMRAVIMCPHGGVITAIPTTETGYRIDGFRPLLMGDVFIVAGCPFSTGSEPMPCQTVTWLAPSNNLIVKGMPALTSLSVGLASGVGPPCPVIVTQTESSMEEPKELTVINY